ncbi:MAG: hypothetical protein U1F11_02500 [Steroidobacteraceae bacterium]
MKSIRTALVIPAPLRLAAAAAGLAATLCALPARAAPPAGEDVSIPAGSLDVARFVPGNAIDADPVTDATDRCVRLIEQREAAAIRACRSAMQLARLDLSDAISYAYGSPRRDLALALGNLAVAHAVNGDVLQAHATVQRALDLAPRESLLAANLKAIEAMRASATGTAQARH